MLVDMNNIVRRTHATTLVITYLLEIKSETWGLAISKHCHLAPGTVYLILDRLVSFGWLSWRWDDTEIPGPRRKLYSVATDARRLMQTHVEQQDIAKSKGKILSGTQTARLIT
jgi:DNA-binding PadR family transcriptional regulator